MRDDISLLPGITEDLEQSLKLDLKSPNTSRKTSARNRRRSQFDSPYTNDSPKILVCRRLEPATYIMQVLLISLLLVVNKQLLSTTPIQNIETFFLTLSN